MVGLFPGRPPRLVVWAATAIPVSLALGTLDAAARACGGSSRGLLAEPPWASAELVALCSDALGRVGTARLPVALGLRRQSAYHRRRPQPSLRGGGSSRRDFRAPTRRLGAREASGHRAGTSAATKRTECPQV